MLSRHRTVVLRPHRLRAGLSPLALLWALGGAATAQVSGAPEAPSPAKAPKVESLTTTAPATPAVQAIAPSAARGQRHPSRPGQEIPRAAAAGGGPGLRRPGADPQSRDLPRHPADGRPLSGHGGCRRLERAARRSRGQARRQPSGHPGPAQAPRARRRSACRCPDERPARRRPGGGGEGLPGPARPARDRADRAPDGGGAQRAGGHPPAPARRLRGAPDRLELRLRRPLRGGEHPVRHGGGGGPRGRGAPLRGGGRQARQGDAARSRPASPT